MVLGEKNLAPMQRFFLNPLVSEMVNESCKIKNFTGFYIFMVKGYSVVYKVIHLTWEPYEGWEGV
jgi:hypothetical protein